MQNQYYNIPALLKERPNWVVWGIRDAPPKSPYNPASLLAGRASPAKAGVPDTWGDYETAVECVRRGFARGIGYEFDGGSVYGVDLDRVIDMYGTLTTQAREIVDSLDSFTERSPGGAGLHIFVLADGADITRHRKKDCCVEIYNEGRYFTVTGHVYGGVKPIETRTAELQAVHDKFLLPDMNEINRVSRPAEGDNGCSVTLPEHERFLGIGLLRDRVFRAMWAGERRHGNESADDQAFMNKLAYWLSTDRDAMIRAFMSSPYYNQKDAAHMKKCQRADYLPNTADKACATVYSTAKADNERYQQSRTRQRSYAR